MAKNELATGRLVIRDESWLRKRAAEKNDPRYIFYAAMLSSDTFEAYYRDVGSHSVQPETTSYEVTGEMEIGYALRRGWVAQEDSAEQLGLAEPETEFRSTGFATGARGSTLPRERGRTPGATRYVLQTDSNPFQAGSSRAPRWPLMVELDDSPGNMARVKEQFPKATRQFFEECKGRGLLTLHVDATGEPGKKKPADQDLRLEQKALEETGYFDLDAKGEVHRSLREIVARRGQQTFRASLLDGYGRQCLVTGCNAEQALEAAHIIPYHQSAQNDPQNGLLLRSDIHTLFDLGLLSIHPDRLTVEVDVELADTVYRELDGKELMFAAGHPLRPSRAALRERYEG